VARAPKELRMQFPKVILLRYKLDQPSKEIDLVIGKNNQSVFPEVLSDSKGARKVISS